MGGLGAGWRARRRQTTDVAGSIPGSCGWNSPTSGPQRLSAGWGLSHFNVYIILASYDFRAKLPRELQKRRQADCGAFRLAVAWVNTSQVPRVDVPSIANTCSFYGIDFTFECLKFFFPTTTCLVGSQTGREGRGVSIISSSTAHMLHQGRAASTL